MDYTPDHAAKAAKQKEIEVLIATFGEAHHASASNHAKWLFENFIAITSPLDPPMVMEMMVMSRLGRGGTKSRKPGNIRLNWRHLFEAVPEVAFAGAGAAADRWLIPFAALYIWMKLQKLATVPIDEKDAFVLYSLWLHRNERKRISEDEAFSKTQSLAEDHEMPTLTKRQFDEAINKLLSLKCIELDSGDIWMREWTIVTY